MNNLQQLRDQLSPLNNPHFDQRDETLDELTAKYEAWLRVPGLTDEEMEQGKEIYYQAIGGVK